MGHLALHSEMTPWGGLEQERPGDGPPGALLGCACYMPQPEVTRPAGSFVLQSHCG
jgi:hypothetical protein